MAVYWAPAFTLTFAYGLELKLSAPVTTIGASYFLGAGLLSSSSESKIPIQDVQQSAMALGSY